ncbi:MAG TPA: GatB/YqeY domain-containing protein [Kofleriaceae bacterium]|nr:GatB/YqeY domain-containing protein [Kofleriaceae bacterium]
MSLEEDLRARLTASMKAKDLRTANVIRMINTKVMERRTAASFKGEVDDEVVRDVIAAYKKSLEKAREEFAAVGERGVEPIAELDFEIGFCEQFLPQQMGDDEARAAVVEALAGMGGAVDPKSAGRVVGAVMKKHKGRVDAARIKQLVDEALKPPAGPT